MKENLTITADTTRVIARSLMEESHITRMVIIRIILRSITRLITIWMKKYSIFPRRTN